MHCRVAWTGHGTSSLCPLCAFASKLRWTARNEPASERPLTSHARNQRRLSAPQLKDSFSSSLLLSSLELSDTQVYGP